MICPICGNRNRDGAKFCVECGAALQRACGECGTPYEAGQRFCAECGAALSSPVTSVNGPQKVPLEGRTAERRLVTVLFADLVGFTALSEKRDAEEVRELLSRYFDTCRRLINLYGGTVEKFIGDAVMAVWGTPVAQEDDAERAVRAALDLVAAVSAFGEEVGASELQARAGVSTGEAAVTLGAEGEGMVAGDLVNTASRIQSAAEAGVVLVGESTKRASEAAIAYEDAGARAMKGKAEPVPVWRALRVVAGSRGAMRSAGLEAPFVGRARELRLIKDLFHGTVEEKKAQIACITGIAGIGKSRLAWEFEKYIDGLADRILWHRGRCLSYGEGVAYWALAEMVRMRCDIVEDEEPTSARAKLRSTLDEHIADPKERTWVEPRLAHLLGIEEGSPGDQENLFSAWRILFERLAEQAPTILVFEDLQWADAGLLDFLEYVLEWSRNHPLFVVALARPEFADKRPTWGAGKRSFTQLYLDPLSPQAMDELLSGLVPGLPDDLRRQILDRAEGVPLYAVETVRMLLDRGLLAEEANAYRPTGPIETLEVPETLHALVAARLDGLTPEERRVVQDAAVLGKTFTQYGLVALSGLEPPQLETVLTTLLRKEIFSVQADPRSPERGQYTFLQDIVKRVAYDTIARRDRRAKHLAAAEFLSAAWGAEEDEIVEVVAAHYLDAYRAAPDTPDAEETRARACDMLVRAAERAASLAATAEAQGAFERAAGLTNDPLTQAELHERAGAMAQAGGRPDEASAHYERAIALFDSSQETHPAARVSARLAEVMWDRGRLEEGLERMDRSLAILSEEEPDADFAALAAQVGRFMFFAGQTELALQRIETALEVAEALGLPETLSQAANTKGIVLTSQGRSHEGLALLNLALEQALEHDKPSAALRAHFNLADTFVRGDRYEDGEPHVRDGLALARRTGNRTWEWAFLGQFSPLYFLGKWDQLLDALTQLPEERLSDARQAFGAVVSIGIAVNVHRGNLDEAARLVDLFGEFSHSSDVQERGNYACGKASLHLARGEIDQAMSLALASFETHETMGITSEHVKEAFVVAVEAALRLGDTDRVESILAVVDGMPSGRRPQFLRAQSFRFHAHLAARRGDPSETERLFKQAAGLLREMAVPFSLGCVLLEHGEWLVENDRSLEAEPLLTEAGEIFDRLQATPWIERVDRTALLVRT